MPAKPSACIQDHFANLTDPRRRKVTYPLVNIVTIPICAVICGADDFVAIAKFGRAKQKWLSRFLDLKAGIPSHDRFNAILAAIKPAEFEACLLSWITALHEITDGQLVAIDAMGCQTEIAQTIVDSGADYVLAVKKNQPTLYDGISWFFLTQREQDFAHVRVSRYQTHEEGHGREETRLYYVCSVPRDLRNRKRWPKLAAIGWTISDTLRDGKRCYEMRYYIMSRKLSAKKFAAAVGGHWSIENSLHWQLDVTFGEDQSRLRRGHADANFSILRRTALSLLKNNKTLKVGVKNKRLAAGWDDSYLQQLLFG
jgi:predicted transposase YbfD/YdcC